MTPKRLHFLATLGLASGLSIAGIAALAADDATVRPVVAAPTATIDAKAAIQTAIALGYTEFRRAGLQGKFYEIEAVDSDGRIVVISLDPETGGLVNIRKDM